MPRWSLMATTYTSSPAPVTPRPKAPTTATSSPSTPCTISVIWFTDTARKGCCRCAVDSCQLTVVSKALTRGWGVESGRARALRSRRANRPDGLRRAATMSAGPRQKRTAPELSHALGPVRLFDNRWPITLNRCGHWGYARFPRVAKLGVRGRKTGCNLLCGKELGIVEQCFSGGVRK